MGFKLDPPRIGDLGPAAPDARAPYTRADIPPLAEASLRFRSSIPFRAAALSIAAAILVPATGCVSGPQVPFVRSDKSYTVSQAQEWARSISLGAASSIQTDQATEARQKALAALRVQGTEPGRAADMLTRGFPAQSRAVPVRVEAATVAGRPAYIVVEATGRPGGTLTSRRVWVFDAATGAVMGSASYK
jgi:hypothetical protein